MHFYIDESGGFQRTTRDHTLSCVGVAIIPGRYLGDVEDGFRMLIADWPRDNNGELKGKGLDERHFTELCAFLEPRQVLFECSVLDTATATEEQVAYHRHRQAEAMTVNLTPEHQAELIADVHRLRKTLEEMPLQLYAQFVTVTEVIWRSVGHGMGYFCQRMPGELGRFRWVIDSKDPSKITKAEDWWRVCVKPMLQSRSRREPMVMLKGGDYSAYRRNFPKVPVPDYLRDEMPGETANDLSGIFREMEFANSREHIGLQIADILTNGIRRALNGNLQRDGWLPLLKLMINHRDGAVRFISLAPADSMQSRPYTPVALQLKHGGRSMLTRKRNPPVESRGSH